MKAPQIVTSTQEQAALAWFIRLHDQPNRADQLEFSRWLQADLAHAEGYAQAQVVWEISEGPAEKLASEDASALDTYLKAMDHPQRSSLWAGPADWRWRRVCC
jgi:transmembrane sensor